MKALIRVFVLIGFLVSFGSTAMAAERIAGDSAGFALPQSVPLVERVSYKNAVVESNRQRKAVERVLEQYQSPMKGSLNTLFDTCNNEGLDCYLLPAIAGLESGFGKYVLAGSYNPFGWGGGYIRFNDWNHAIQTVGTGIQENYISNGAQTVEQIGRLYAESPTWAARVRRYMSEFQHEENKIDLGLTKQELEL